MNTIILTDIYNNIDELAIMENIRDFAFGTPRQNYNQVIQELRDRHPVCDMRNCRYKQTFTTSYLPLLHRSTHASCTIIGCENGLSDYSHNVCHKCATENEFPVEFEYFHRACV